MQYWTFDEGRDDLRLTRGAELQTAGTSVSATLLAAAPDAAPDELEPEAETLAPGPTHLVPDLIHPDLAEADVVDAGPVLSFAAPAAPPADLMTSDGVSIAQILRDRPDVFAAFFTEYYGAGNDRHSEAWANRVGEATPEAYASYWYEHYGRFGGYVAGSSGSLYGAPVEEPLVFSGRTTFNGIPLSQILHDRPDIYRAFFTEYYGANNDRHSDAWQNRVGGATPEDYANYWYETYGKYGAYSPSVPASPTPDPEPQEPPPIPTDEAPDGPEIVDLGPPDDDAAALSVGQSLLDPTGLG